MSRPVEDKSHYYIVTAQLEEKNGGWAPEVQAQHLKGVGNAIVICLPMPTSDMTRVHMTRLLLWLPTVRQQLRELGIRQDVIDNVCHSILTVRKKIRTRLHKLVD
jgi:hypothetical protein